MQAIGELWDNHLTAGAVAAAAGGAAAAGARSGAEAAALEVPKNSKTGGAQRAAGRKAADGKAGQQAAAGPAGRMAGVGGQKQQQGDEGGAAGGLNDGLAAMEYLLLLTEQAHMTLGSISFT